MGAISQKNMAKIYKAVSIQGFPNRLFFYS